MYSPKEQFIIYPVAGPITNVIGILLIVGLLTLTLGGCAGS